MVFVQHGHEGLEFDATRLVIFVEIREQGLQIFLFERGVEGFYGFLEFTFVQGFIIIHIHLLEFLSKFILIFQIHLLP